VQEKVERLSEQLQQKEDESSKHNSLLTVSDAATIQSSLVPFGGNLYGGNVSTVDSPAITSSSSAGLAAGLSAKQRSQLPPQPHQLKMPKGQ
jgi:hypothetical protein